MADGSAPPHLLALVFFLALPLLVHAVSGTKYQKPQKSWNNSTLRLLNKEGLTGRYTGFAANRTGDIDFQLWFVNFTDNSYLLSMIAINVPQSWNHAQDVDARIIWTADRGNFVGENASFSFTEYGNLELKDEKEKTVWSTETQSKEVEFLSISEMGNVVLRTKELVPIWQSFDSLTDTLMDQRALKASANLTSWASSNDSTEGDYSLVVEHSGLVLYANQHQPYWIWGYSGEQTIKEVTESNQTVFAAICRSEDNLTVSFQLGSNFASLQSNNTLKEHCRDINASSSSIEFGKTPSYAYATFLKLLPNGDLKLYSWYNTSWIEVYSLFQNDPCSLPRKCGDYGVCKDGECVGCVTSDGYKDQPECKSDISSSCSSQLEELKGGYDYFTIKYQTSNVLSKRECQDACSKDCSCKAAFYNSSASSCFMVNDTLATVQGLSDDGLIVFIKVPSSSLNWKVITGGIVAGLVASMLLIFLVCRLKRKNHISGSENGDNDDATLIDTSLRGMLPNKFSYKVLQVATNNFSYSIGAGGFGEVYKGTLSDGTVVAVKKLEKLESHRNDFYTEISILGRSHHQNLVTLLGFCTTAKRSLLVYEHMENSSLDKWLFGDKAPLNWKQRFEIAVGTARGLAYLHEECSDKIIHLDLKPQNILLDLELRPKIADFGISRHVDRKQSFIVTNMKGTPGYLAPEWLAEGAITEKADVYSFGIVLLEIVSGRSNSDLLRDGFNFHSLEWDWTVLLEKEKKFVDPDVLYSLDETEANRVLKIASLCILDDPCLRPSMGKVVQMLEGVVGIPDPPNLRYSLNPQTRAAFIKLLGTKGSSSGSALGGSSSSFFSGGR